MNANIFAKANQLIKSCDTAYIGVIDENGFPSVSTISIIKPENIFEIYFSTDRNGNKTKRLEKNNKASLCFKTDDSNITLVGETEFVSDQETKNQYWLDWFIHHYPGGKTDPDYVLIKFTTKRVSLWIESEGAEFPIEALLTVQSRCGLLCDSCKFKEPCNCGGCIQTMGHPFHGECPIATCSQAKGYHHCGECDIMPCDQLYKYSCSDGEHSDSPKGARLDVLRSWSSQPFFKCAIIEESKVQGLNINGQKIFR